MYELDISDVLKIAFDNMPDAATQRALVEEIKKLKVDGVPESRATELVLGHLLPGNKAH